MRRVLAIALLLVFTSEAALAQGRSVPSTKAQREAEQMQRRAMDRGMRAQRKMQKLEANRIEAQGKAQTYKLKREAKEEALKQEKEGKAPGDTGDIYESSDLVRQLQE